MGGDCSPPVCMGNKGHGHSASEMYATSDVEGDAYRCSLCRNVVVLSPQPEVDL